ncbi:MAG: hypothetical protein AB8B71_04410 [Paracoccaceae bacterium]
MTDAKLAAPVGAAREGKGKKVANNKNDVLLVQQMMRFNGYLVAKDGKVTSRFIKEIKRYQSNECNSKTPDGIVDPGGTTFKKLLPKYKKDMKTLEDLEAELEKTMVYTIKYKGKEIVVLEEDYDRVRNETLKFVKDLLKVYEKTVVRNRKSLDDIMKQVNMKDDFVKNMSARLIFSFRDVEPPKPVFQKKSEAYVAKIKGHIGSKNFAGIESDMPRLELVMGQAHKEMIDYLNSFQGAAKLTADVFNGASAVGFAIVGIFAAPAILASAATAGVTLSAAGTFTAVGGGLAMLQTGSQELGKHAYGAKPGQTLGKSALKIVIDGTVGAILGRLGAKLPTNVTTEVVEAVAKEGTKKFAWLTMDNAKRLLMEAVKDGGSEMINQLKNALNKSIDTGKPPTQDELTKAISDVVFAAIGGPLFNKFTKAETNLVKNNDKFIKDAIASPVVKKVLKKKKLTPKDLTDAQRLDMADAILTGIKKKVLTVSGGKMYDVATGKDTASNMVKKAQDATAADSTVQQLAERAAGEYLKRQKIGVKK